MSILSKWLRDLVWPHKFKVHKIRVLHMRLDSMPDKYKYISVKDVYDGRKIAEEAKRVTERFED